MPHPPSKLFLGRTERGHSLGVGGSRTCETLGVHRLGREPPLVATARKCSEVGGHVPLAVAPGEVRHTVPHVNEVHVDDAAGEGREVALDRVTSNGHRAQVKADTEGGRVHLGHEAQKVGSRMREVGLVGLERLNRKRYAYRLGAPHYGTEHCHAALPGDLNWLVKVAPTARDDDLART